MYVATLVSHLGTHTTRVAVLPYISHSLDQTQRTVLEAFEADNPNLDHAALDWEWTQSFDAKTKLTTTRATVSYLDVVTTLIVQEVEFV